MNATTTTPFGPPASIEELVEMKRYLDLASIATKQRDTIVQLEHDIAVAHRVEASLRAEVTELRANDARWAKRLKALEARLEHIGQIAAGHALVEEGNAEE